MKKIALLLTASLATLSAQSVNAQGIDTAFDITKLGVGVGIGTLGLEITPTYDLTSQFAISAPLTFGGLDLSFTDDDGNDIEGSLSTESLGVLVDFHPAGGPFFLSAGLALGGYEISGSVTDPTIDGVNFNGTFTLGVRQSEDIAPVLGVGFSSRRPVGLSGYFRLGARLSDLELYEEGAAAAGVNQADIDNALAGANADLDGVSVIPSISFGMVFRF